MCFKIKQVYCMIPFRNIFRYRIKICAEIDESTSKMFVGVDAVSLDKVCFNNGRIYYIITSCIRMLDSDWLLAVIYFTNSCLAL